MLPFVFMQYLFDDLYLYIFILVCYSSVYYFLVRKYIYSIIDPLFLYTLFSCFGGAVVFFMFIKELISLIYLQNFIFTQLAFVFGFRFFKPINFLKIVPCTANSKKHKTSNTFILWLYIAASLIYIVSQIITYAVAGIPILYESRLEYYISGSGFGFFSRIIYVTSLITIFLLIHRFNNWKGTIFSKMYDIFVLLNIVINFLLSGSKSAFLLLLFVTFYYSIFTIRINGSSEYFDKIKKCQYGMLILAVVAAVTVFLIQDMGQYGDNVGLIAFVNRLLLNGEVYVMAYPNAVIENMQWHNPILVIFQDFLGLFRLVAWEDFPTTLGFELYRFLVPDAGMVGPNPRHNIFGYVYFGFYGSILFSFSIGFILSFVRNKLYFMFKPTIITGLVYMLVSLPIAAIETDIGMVIGSLDSTLLVLLPLIVVVYIIDRGAASINTTKRQLQSLAYHA